MLWAPGINVKLPSTVAAFGFVVLGRFLLGQLHAHRLKAASESISIDASKQIVLRYAVWYYVFPLVLFILSGGFGYAASQASRPQAAFLQKLLCLFALLGAIFLVYRQATACVKITENKLIYTEGGDCREVAADDVVSVAIKGFNFVIRLKWQKMAIIPATFAHSEIILAFLQQAAARN